MFIHLWDVHFDFVPPPPYDTMFDPEYSGEITGENFFHDPRIHARMPGKDLRHLLSLYDGEIAWTDQHIALILDDLEARGLLEDTVVVITSDHGEEFFEHGRKGHRMTLYDEVIRIPLLIWYPSKVAAGTRVSSATGLIDVFPTLLELAGIDSAPNTMGRSLVPLMQGARTPGIHVAVSELNTLGRHLTSFRSPRYKLLVDEASGHAVTYDLRIDRKERLGNRVTGTGPTWEHELVAAAQASRSELAEQRRARATAISSARPGAALVDQLEALGYLGEAARDAEAGTLAPERSADDRTMR